MQLIILIDTSTQYERDIRPLQADAKTMGDHARCAYLAWRYVPILRQ